jgi:peptide/nickel transport system substrate-binding protein
MTRRDAGIILVLLVALGVLAAAVVAPSLAPAATAAPSASPVETPAVGLVQGVVGRPSSITPVTARTQVDRDLVALLFRGLVRLGPGTSIVPDLATGWSVDKKGKRWTFQLRDDAFWHDGVPVTSDDVIFTLGVLQSPEYTGPLAATWADVQARALDARTVQFELGNPAGNFLQATTLPLLPAHILQGVPVADLADDPFALDPIGNGPFALVELSDASAVLEPVLPQVDAPAAPLEDAAAGAPAVRTPRLPRLELRFFDSAADLGDAFTAGEVASAGDLPPADAVALAEAAAGARAVRYPGTTLTAVTFNLRSLKGPFSDQRTRRALLAAIDRDALIADLLAGAGVRADTMIQPSSWAYDAKAAPEVKHDPARAAELLRAAGWKRSGEAWIAPGEKKPMQLKLLAPEESANPIVHGTAERVAAAWTAIGLATEVEALPAGEFVGRLRDGDYAAAVLDVNMGLDPDPYPILASSQARKGGSNVSGIQLDALDRALAAARAPGTTEARTQAYRDLQALLGTLQPMPTLFFRDVVMVADAGLTGPVPRPVSDPGDRFWDVVRWDAGR